MSEDAKKRKPRAPKVKEPESNNVPVVQETEVEVVKENTRDSVALIKQETEKLKLPAENSLELWNEEFSKIEIAGLDDKENLAKLKDAKKILRTARIQLEDKRKEVKDFYLTVGKAIDEHVRPLREGIERIEIDVDKKLKAYDELVEAEERRKEIELNKKRDDRVKELNEAGMVFNGAYYAIGENISMDINSIRDLPDDQYEILLNKVKFEKVRLDKIEADRKEEERLAEEKRKEDQRRIDEENQRLAEERRQQEEERRKLDEERANIRRQKIKMRIDMLDMLGMRFLSSFMCYRFENKAGKSEVMNAFLEGATDEEWGNELARVKDQIHSLIDEEKNIIAQEQEKERIRQEKEARLNALKTDRVIARSSELMSKGMYWDEGKTALYFHVEAADWETIKISRSTLEDADDEKYAELLQVASDEIIRLMGKAEEARIQKAAEEEKQKSEVQKAIDYYNAICGIQMPDISSAQLLEPMEKIRDGISDLVKAFEVLLPELYPGKQVQIEG